jgi:gliding motility-associated-like protein
MKPSLGKHTDDSLREVLQTKLGEHQSAVPDGLWDKIESALPTASAATTTAVAWKSIALWVAGAAAVVAGTVAMVMHQQTTNSTSASDKIETTTAIPQPNANEESPVVRQTSNPEQPLSTSEYQLKPIPEIPSGITFQLPEVNKVDAVISTEWKKTCASTSESPINELKESSKPEHIQTLEQPETFNANFTVAELNETESTFFFFPENTGKVTYSWDFGDGLKSDEQSVHHTYDEPGEYEVTLFISDVHNNKTASSKQTVIVKETACIRVPNVFTPNGDSSNDTFDVLSLSRGIEGIDFFQIVSSTGRVIYEGTSSTWNGNDRNGEPSAEDNYFYIVRAKTTDGKLLTRKGLVRLERN